MALAPSGVGTAYLYDTQVSGTGGYSDIISSFPPSVNPPILFEPDPSLSAGQISLWIIVTGPGEDWGGCQIWASVDGGTSYGQLGTMLTGGVQGILTADFPSGTDPDTTNVLSVDTTMSNGTIDTATAGDADVGVTLAYVDGELVGYSNVVLTGPDLYDLDTYLRRGLFNTPAGLHLTGTQFGLISGQVFSHTYPSIMIGTTIHLKFPSFNSVGGSLEDISTLPDYTYTLTGAGLARGIWATPISLGGSFVDMALDPWDGNYELFDVQAPWDINFKDNFDGSPVPGCSVPPGVTVTMQFQIVDAAGTAISIGTFVILAGELTGTFTCSAFTLSNGDRLRLYAPATIDTTIAGLYGTIVGARN